MSGTDSRLRDVAGFSAARLARFDSVLGIAPGLPQPRRWHGDDARGDFPKPTMTKPLVSLVAVMLAAERRLHLSQPVADFIPALPALACWVRATR